MDGERKERRVKERLRLALPVRVLCRESAQEEWTEQTRLVNLTPFGASLNLTRPVEPGRLLHLTMPMPRQLRCFDHIEDQYRVYAIVRWIKLVPEGGERPFALGAAFTGKRPPQGYLEKPMTRYEVVAEGAGALWQARERVEKRRAVVERETRLTMPVEVVVEVLGERGEIESSETTVTADISRHGASIFTTLQVGRGKFVRLRSARYSLAVLAVVRGGRKGEDNIPRLHLEFIDREWPLEILE